MCSLAVNNDPQVLRAVLENSNVSSTDKNFVLRVAAMAGRTEKVKVLLEAGADVQNSSAVTAAAGYHQVESLKLLCEQGADVNEKDFKGDSALIVAAQNRCVNCLKYLVENGTDVNYLTPRGKSALTVATLAFDMNTMQLLVQNGANVNMEDWKSGTPLSYLAKCVHKCKGFREALIDQEDCEHSTCLKLLIRQGADVNTMDAHGETPLLKACRMKNGTFVKILLDSGADVNTRNNEWATPLWEAYHNKCLTSLKALIKYGADVNAQSKRIVPTQVAVGRILIAAGMETVSGPDYFRWYLEELCPSDQDRMRLKHLCRMVVRNTLMKETPKTNLYALVPKLLLPSSILNYILLNVSL